MNKVFCSLIGAVIAFVVIFGVTVEARYHDDDWEPDHDWEFIPCWNCSGSGQCPTCNGTGEIIEEEIRTCDECYGLGQCQQCFGSGHM